MAEREAPRSYTREESEAILHRALVSRADAGVTHDELTAAAREVGVSAADLDAAAAALTAQRADDEARARDRARKLRGVGWHALSFVLVNAMLFASARSSGATWHLWPLFGWMLGLAFHAAGVFFAPVRSPAERAERGARRARRAEKRAGDAVPAPLPTSAVAELRGPRVELAPAETERDEHDEHDARGAASEPARRDAR